MATNLKAAAVWEAWMAIAMVGALTTQIQVAGVGIGAVALLTGLAPALALVLWRGPRAAPNDSLALFAFWSTLAAALCLGVIASVALAVPVDLSLVAHDVVAYLLLTLFTLTLAVLPRRTEALRRMQWGVAIFGAAVAALQLGNANGLFALPNVDPWYWDRMRGWAENPNQFALLCLLTGFTALALVNRAGTAACKAVAFLCAAVSLAVGMQSKSNAYLLMVVAGLLAYLLLKGGRLMWRAERSGFPAMAAAFALVAAVGVVLTPLLAKIDVSTGLMSAAGDVARKGDDESADAALRVALWRQAIATGLSTGALGLGPGPHLAIPASLIAARKSEDEPINLVHPKVGLAPNFEAHNTVLELFVQGGALAVCAFVAVLTTGVVRAWRAKEDGVIALIIAVVAFGSFHVVFRHPLVWFCLCLGVLATRRRRGPASAAGWLPARLSPSDPSERGVLI